MPKQSVKAQAAAAALVALRTANLHAGAVFHVPCGGRIHYTLVREAYICTWCQGVWRAKEIIKEIRGRGRRPELLGYEYSGPGVEVRD